MSPSRSSSAALCIFLLLTVNGVATAKVQLQRAPPPMWAILDAGTYHMASGTWLPAGSEMPGMDVIYNNSSLCPYFQAMGLGQEWFDAGNVPSTTCLNNGAMRRGCADQYQITGIQFGYCTDQPSVDWRLRFIDQFLISSIAESGSVTTLDLPGMPGSPVAPTPVCLIVTVDLRGSGQEFILMADGDGTYDGTPGASNYAQFGYAMRAMNLTGSSTGALFAGNPNSDWRGTRWSRPHVDYSEVGAGRWNNGDIAVTGVSWAPNGITFDIHFCQGFYLRLFANACGDPTGAPFCTGHAGAPCPCGNSSPALNREGCRNSLNGVNGGRLEATGNASLSSDSLRLTALRVPPGASVLYFQGTTTVGGGLGAVFGDGLRCVGGEVLRLTTGVADSDGEVQIPMGGAGVATLGNVATAGTRTYQAWYRNAASYCLPSAFNLTNGWQLDWSP